MDKSLSDLAKEVYEKVKLVPQMTRAELNLEFQATSDTRRNAQLSRVIKSLLKHRHLSKHMDIKSNTVEFWVPNHLDNRPGDMVDPYIDEEDFLGIARGHVSWKEEPRLEPVLQEKKKTEEQETSAEPVNFEEESDKAFKKIEEQRVERRKQVRASKDDPDSLTPNKMKILEIFGTEADGPELTMHELYLAMERKHDLPRHVISRLVHTLSSVRLLQQVWREDEKVCRFKATGKKEVRNQGRDQVRLPSIKSTFIGASIRALKEEAEYTEEAEETIEKNGTSHEESPLQVNGNSEKTPDRGLVETRMDENPGGLEEDTITMSTTYNLKFTPQVYVRGKQIIVQRESGDTLELTEEETESVLTTARLMVRIELNSYLKR